MRVVQIDEIVNDERNIPEFQPDDSGNHSYGWMPKMLKKFDVAALDRIVHIMNEAKQGTFPSDEELTFLKASINNSLVGPSKLLHFINPKYFAIWDSRVFHYIEGRIASHSNMSSLINYRDYHENVRVLVRDKRFPEVHRSMNRKIGYQVSRMRACEYVMYLTNGHGVNGR
jgi:hypothetical protein